MREIPDHKTSCEACGGTGAVEIGRHYVTRDMAIDAGDRSMEGMEIGVEYGPCPECLRAAAELAP
jgi:hypothetical protein